MGGVLPSGLSLLGGGEVMHMTQNRHNHSHKQFTGGS